MNLQNVAHAFHIAHLAGLHQAKADRGVYPKAGAFLLAPKAGSDFQSMVEQRLFQRAHQILQRPGAVGLHGALRPIGQKHHRDPVALLMDRMGQFNAVHIRQGKLNENQVKAAALQPGQQLFGRIEMGGSRGCFPGWGA